MRDYSSHHSCKICIWNDQCGSEQLCNFYDVGKYDIYSLSDDDIQEMVEVERKKYKKAYESYLKNFYNERLCKND